MTNKKFGFLVMRAQPLHTGHRYIIGKAAKMCDHLTIILGSANSPRTIKNPWTYLERQLEVNRFLAHEGLTNVGIYPINDYIYSDTQWLADFNQIIADVNTDGGETIIFGHTKPGNDYLNWFPQYTNINIETEFDGLNATTIRANWFENSPHLFHEDVVADWEYFKQEDKMFSSYPYPDTLNFCCGDTVLECGGHILLIKRKRAPGRNTWALPGGFKNNTETYIDCAFRELVEETNVRVPEKILRGSVVQTKLYDSPTRGMGIPRNTLAVHIVIGLNADGTFPRVSPMDDALETQWVPIGKIINDMALFDDHSHIIMDMCKVTPVPAHKNARFCFQN